MFILLRHILLVIACLPFISFATECTLVDDAGLSLTVQTPPTRVVSLSPHITELVFSVGGQDLLVGVSEYSDYPEAAKALPRVGGYGSLSTETLLGVQPDLVLAWPDKVSAPVLEQLESLGIVVLRSDPRTYQDIARNLRWIGCALGHGEQAAVLADQVEKMTHDLRSQYGGRKPVKVFFQLGGQPMMSQNRNTFIHQAIELCGGENLFADAPSMAPLVNEESVVAMNPDIIITADDGSGQPAWLTGWTRFSGMSAVTNQQMYAINADRLFRPTLRFMEGTKELCELIDRAR